MQENNMKSCQRYTARIICISFLSLVLVIISLLRFLPPQAHWLVYVFQAYVSPTYPGGDIPIPESYTGPWHSWYPDGHMRSKSYIEKGVMIGALARWHPDGRIASFAECTDNKVSGMVIQWNSDTNVTTKYIMRHKNGMRLHGFTISSTKGESHLDLHLNGPCRATIPWSNDIDFNAFFIDPEGYIESLKKKPVDELDQYWEEMQRQDPTQTGPRPRPDR